jgi:hypothetical protein
VVEGLVPAIASEDYLKETRNKRKRKAKQYEGFETSNIIDRQTVNNSRSFYLYSAGTDHGYTCTGMRAVGLVQLLEGST